MPASPPRFRRPLGDPLLPPCVRSWREVGHAEVPAGSAPRPQTVLKVGCTSFFFSLLEK